MGETTNSLVLVFNTTSKLSKTITISGVSDTLTKADVQTLATTMINNTEVLDIDSSTKTYGALTELLSAKVVVTENTLSFKVEEAGA